MSPLDLDAMHGRACVLRNTSPGHEEDGETPEVVYLYEREDGSIFHAEAEIRTYSDHDLRPVGCMLLVGAGCEMLTVATNEGEQMPDVADAICRAGADQLALIARVKELEAASAKAEAEVERLDGWLAKIEGGDSPCTDEAQLRRWAYEGGSLGHPVPQ